VPPSVSDIEDQPTHNACLPGFHHGTYPRRLFTKLSPLDEGISLYFFFFLIFLPFFFSLLDGLTITHGAYLLGFHHGNG